MQQVASPQPLPAETERLEFCWWPSSTAKATPLSHSWGQPSWLLFPFSPDQQASLLPLGIPVAVLGRLGQELEMGFSRGVQDHRMSRDHRLSPPRAAIQGAQFIRFTWGIKENTVPATGPGSGVGQHRWPGICIPAGARFQPPPPRPPHPPFCTPEGRSQLPARTDPAAPGRQE